MRKALIRLSTQLLHRSSTVPQYAMSIRFAAVHGQLPHCPPCYPFLTYSVERQISDDIPGIQVVSTSGPDSKTGNIIPQMFIAFRGQFPISYSTLTFWSNSQCYHHSRYSNIHPYIPAHKCQRQFHIIIFILILLIPSPSVHNRSTRLTWFRVHSSGVDIRRLIPTECDIFDWCGWCRW